MEGLKLFLIFLTHFLLRNGVISQDSIPPPEDLCMSEAKLERKQILTQLTELKSYLESQFGSISAFDSRLKNIERLLTTIEERTNIKMDELGKMLKDLSRKKPQDGPKSRHHEQMWTRKSEDGNDSKKDYCKVNSLRNLVPNLEGPMEDIQRRVGALQKESQKERARRTEKHQKVVFHLEELHTAVDPRGAYLHYRKYENTAARRKDLETMLKDPKATFYKGENLTGEGVSYDSSSTTTLPEGCHNVNGIQSMQMSNSCVRVFEGDNCNDISRALYPKPDSGNFINFLTPEFSSIYSVGPCLPNEFQFVSVSLIGSRIAVTKDESYVRQVPDFFDIYGLETFSHISTSIRSSTYSIRKYYMDQGRPKWIFAVIYKRHLKSNNESISGMNMAIPPELGGPTNQAYNTFNQTRENFEEWKRITDEVVVAHKQTSTEWVVASVTFVYDTPSAPDPFGFYYYINTNFKKQMYGFIENSLHS